MHTDRAQPDTVLKSILDGLVGEAYEPRGIPHSEMWLILYTIHRLGIKRIIETGRARGQSTYLLGKYLPDVEIHSFELRFGPDEVFARERVAGLSNVVLHLGDSTDMVPHLAAQSDLPTAILCDGPKGEAAARIIERCFVWPHVRVGFIHDMRRLDHGKPSPHRLSAMRILPKHKFSDDPEIVASSSWMDARVVAAHGPVGPEHEAVYGSYGPTIGVFFNKQ